MDANLRSALLGGPGLDGYAFNADVYCVDCGRETIRALHAEGKLPEEGSPEFGDTEHCPIPIFFGESPDWALHCGECGEYLYGESSEEDDNSEPDPDEEGS